MSWYQEIAKGYVRKFIHNIFYHQEYIEYKKLVNIFYANFERGGGVYSFILDGQIITDGTKLGLKEKKTNIHPSLIKEARIVVKYMQKIKSDKQRVESFLNTLFKHTTCEQDVRDILPELIINLDSYFSNLPRTRPAGYPFASGSPQKNSFDSMTGLIFVYIGLKSMDE